MKIFAAGISTETNTFAALPTALEDFFIVRGQDVVNARVAHPALDLSATWGQQAASRGDVFIFALMAWAQPAGLTVRSAYEALRDELLRDLEAALPVDVVLLNLHGAMVAHGYRDCEEDIIRRVRETVGSGTVIGVEFDLHCHLSESKISAADLVVTYKEYPHVDPADRAHELFELSVAAKLGEILPTTAIFDCRMIGLYPTSREPLRSFVDAMIERERHHGVLSISLGHGFQFADVPNVGAKVLVITNNDRALANEVARDMGLRVYGMRREIGCESFSLPTDEAFKRALAGNRIPVVVADQSDNPGGGAPGDSTVALRWLIEHKIFNAAVAIIYDPEVVRIARKVGLGTTFAFRIGGKLSAMSGTPVDLEATVLSVCERYMQAFPQANRPPEFVLSGNLVALRSLGIDIVVSDRRCQCFSPGVFSDLGIDPKSKRLLVVKSAQHFFAGFAPIAGEIVYMSAPGAVIPDPKQIAYRQVDTSLLYPWTVDPLHLDTRSPR